MLLPFKNLFFFYLFASWYSVKDGTTLISIFIRFAQVYNCFFLKAKILYNLIAVYQPTVLISVRPPDSSDMNSFIVFILLNPLCKRMERGAAKLFTFVFVVTFVFFSFSGQCDQITQLHIVCIRNI